MTRKRAQTYRASKEDCFPAGPRGRAPGQGVIEGETPEAHIENLVEDLQA